jgi:hypothetical protein
MRDRQEWYMAAVIAQSAISTAGVKGEVGPREVCEVEEAHVGGGLSG